MWNYENHSICTPAMAQQKLHYQCKVTFSFCCFYINIDGVTPNDLKKNPEIFHFQRQAFAAQHGSFLRSEGKCLLN